MLATFANKNTYSTNWKKRKPFFFISLFHYRTSVFAISNAISNSRSISVRYLRVIRLSDLPIFCNLLSFLCDPQIFLLLRHSIHALVDVLEFKRIKNDFTWWKTQERIPFSRTFWGCSSSRRGKFKGLLFQVAHVLERKC